MAVKNGATLLIGGGDGDGGIIKSLTGGLTGRGLVADESSEELRQL